MTTRIVKGLLQTLMAGSLLIVNAPGFAQSNMKMEGKKESNSGGNTKAFAPLDTTVIKTVFGMKGTANNGEYKFSIPQNDLDVKVDGFKITPPMGLGTWVAFTPAKDGVMFMGDIVVTETDLKPVQQEIIKQGLTSTAIHNHFLRNHPSVMYMHMGGMGSTEVMAQKAKAVLDKVKELRGGDPSKGTASAEAVANTINTKSLDGIFGAKGEMTKGVFKYTFGRPDVDLREHGVKITTFLGFNTWAAWQGTPDKAAVAGDFVMLEDEVEPVVKALIENNIEVVALHNHMVHEKPHVFFLHYWGIGNAEQLAKGLKAAIDQTGKKQGSGMNMKM